MTTITRTTVLALAASLTMGLAPLAAAASPKAQLVAPGPGFDHLPRFGFHSHNIRGVGERVTHVRWNSRAARIGLERGDTILALNDCPLTYHGAWRDALREAMYSGGWVRLAIRDVRTGHVVYRQTYVGGPGHGPITPKSHGVAYGPPTYKSKSRPHRDDRNGIRIDLGKQIANLVDNLND